MCVLPSFLLPLLDLDGVWEEILEYLYDFFKRDFLEQHLYYENLRVDFDRRMENNKEIAFWHLITKKDKRLGRIPDYKRAKRLPWNRPIIENHNNSEIKEWHYLEGNGEIRKYLWLENYNFCVILEMRRNEQIIILVTAFYVEEWKKRDLEKRYQKRIEETS